MNTETPFATLTDDELEALADCRPDCVGECDVCHGDGDLYHDETSDGGWCYLLGAAM